MTAKLLVPSDQRWLVWMVGTDGNRRESVTFRCVACRSSETGALADQIFREDNTIPMEFIEPPNLQEIAAAYANWMAVDSQAGKVERS